MLEIFQSAFMVRAVLAGLVVSIIAPLIGIFLVIRRYSYIVDTLSHVSLVGVAASTLFHSQPIIGAISVSVLSAWGIEYLRYKKKLMGESILSLFLFGSLAAALVIMGAARGINAGFLGYLFGSIITISVNELLAISILGLLVAAAIITLFKKLFIISAAEELAVVEGLPVKMLNFTIMTLAALTIGVSIRAVGALLIGALIVIPVVAAIQMEMGFKKTIIWALAISLSSTIAGLFLSYYLNLPSGGVIVLVLIFMFFVAALSNRGKAR